MTYKSVKKYRRKIKESLLFAFDGKCGICDYDKCSQALHFHHINPEDKSFSLSGSNVANIKKIAAEAEKCICVCSNCHVEIHAGVTSVPKNIRRFQSSLFLKNKTYMDSCPVCKEPKQIKRKTCSKKCSSLQKRRVDWDKLNIHHMWLNSNYTKIAKSLGVSDATVKKWHLRQLKK